MVIDMIESFYYKCQVTRRAIMDASARGTFEFTPSEFL